MRVSERVASRRETKCCAQPRARTAQGGQEQARAPLAAKSKTTAAPQGDHLQSDNVLLRKVHRDSEPRDGVGAHVPRGGPALAIEGLVELPEGVGWCAGAGAGGTW